MIERVLNTSGAEALHAFTWNLIESVVGMMQHGLCRRELEWLRGRIEVSQRASHFTQVTAEARVFFHSLVCANWLNTVEKTAGNNCSVAGLTRRRTVP